MTTARRDLEEPAQEVHPVHPPATAGARTGRIGLPAPAQPPEFEVLAGAQAAHSRTLRAVAPVVGGQVRPVRLDLLLFSTDLAAVVAVAMLLTAGGRRWEPLVIVTAMIISRAGSGLHRRRLRLSWMDDLPRSAIAFSAAAGVVAAALITAGAASAELTAAAVALGASWLAAEAVRSIVLLAVRSARVRFGAGEPTLVVGSGEVGRDLVEKMLAHPEFGLRPLAVVDPAPGPSAPGSCAPDLGVPLFRAELDEAVRDLRPSTVVLAFGALPDEVLVDTVIAAHQYGCRILLVPRMFELYLDAPGVERLRSYPLVRLPEDPTRRLAWRIKRLLDVVVAAAALVLVAPLLLACAVAILIESGRPVLFTQRRIGRDGRTFHLYKLRTLVPSDEHESETLWSVANDARIGRVGRVLRRTSLDELPQLWNIVRGDMSLVGPRPERPGFVHLFSEQYPRYGARHRVPAGLTGLAQINGLRGDTSIADRVRYDNYYIGAWSLWLDLKVILLTLRELLRRGEY